MIIFTVTPATPFHYDPDKRTITVWRDEPRFDDWCSHVFPHRHHHWVIDSYYGILLVQICDRLLLCNPITKSYKFLPSSSLVMNSSGCWKIGYDDVLKQYKVFGLRKIKNEYSLYVFDVQREGESHPPRKIKAMIIEEHFREHLNQSVLVNGSVYWLIIARWVNCATYIISANVTTEEVKTQSCFSTPLILTHNYDHFFAANGTFYLEQTYYPNYDPKYDLQLWVLEGLESENPNPSWIIKNRIEKLRLSSILRNIDVHAVGVFRDKMLIMVSSNRENELYQYDLGNEKIEKVTLARDDNNERGVVRFVYFRFIEHIDSLLSLGPIDDEVWV